MSATASHQAHPVSDQFARAASRDTSRARWRLRAVRAEIVEFGPDGDPDLVRVTDELEHLELAAAARP
ncbi:MULTISPECIES: hypothetical protein [Nocardiopsidaceae]|uniref:Uncharacterized protein n=2 Tax=Nocardiopsidaceae TaxID=83676 RepID=A0ABY6YGR4_9ACTN|nr:hypothetical protein [Streptomonospora nanhaiensis]MEE2044864.1 hypothetical protein [Nocardiopsis tropica]WAE71458.1 hypothetical protein OUQ99_19715 [Streptomonospora nanhaiensis]